MKSAQAKLLTAELLQPWLVYAPSKFNNSLNPVHLKLVNKEQQMGACACGYTTDPEKNCNGTHNVVKAVKADIIAKLEANGHADAAESLKTK